MTRVCIESLGHASSQDYEHRARVLSSPSLLVWLMSSQVFHRVDPSQCAQPSKLAFAKNGGMNPAAIPLLLLFEEGLQPPLEALAVHNGRPRLVVLGLGDPHLLERGQRRQDGAADPD